MFGTIQNQLKKTSDIRQPKFTIEKMAENCHQPASFSKENTFFEDYFFWKPNVRCFFD